MSIQVSSIPGAVAVGSKSAQQRDAYLTALLEQVAYHSPDDGLQDLREGAIALVREQTFPSTRDEEWRFTDLSSMLQVAFQTASEPTSLFDLTSFVLPEATNSRLVFVDGVYAPQFSSITDLPNVIVGNLSQLAVDYRDRLPNYLAQQQGANEVFTALNTAGLTDAAIVWLPKQQVIEAPIHLLFVSTTNSPVISQPRCLVVAEPDSALTLVEEYAAVGSGVYFTNSVTEIWIEANAQINHTRVQRDDKAAFHIGRTAVSQARDSRYTCNAISLGAARSRHNLTVIQVGEQTETTLNGLTMITGEQLSDTHSAMVYTKPHSSSSQLHKCIVGDRAHAVFNGKVFVPKAAQLTNAGQLNRNLLLSPKARVDTKPQLEIVADNVKCAHGATVSQLDEEEVFYLQSRGIDKASAQRLLVYAFALEVINQIPIASLEEILAQLVSKQV